MNQVIFKVLTAAASPVFAQRQCTVLTASSATTDGPLFFGQFLPFSRHKSNLEHYNHVDTKWCFFFHFILDFFFTSAIHKIDGIKEDGMYLVIRHQMLVSKYVLESSSANVVYRQMSCS